MEIYLMFSLKYSELKELTHWGRVTHIRVSKITINGSDNGLSPGRPQAIIWTNAGILLIRPLGTNFSEILIKILTFSFKKIHLKVPSAKQRPFCLGLNVLTSHSIYLPANNHAKASRQMALRTTSIIQSRCLLFFTPTVYQQQTTLSLKYIK